MIMSRLRCTFGLSQQNCFIIAITVFVCVRQNCVISIVKNALSAGESQQNVAFYRDNLESLQ